MADLNIVCKMIKLLEENRRNLSDLGLTKEFLNLRKNMSQGKNIAKLDIIKIKNFSSVKDTVKRMNLQITDPTNDL